MEFHHQADSYEKFRPRLTAYLLRILHRRQLAEDLVQTTFLRALEARDSCPKESPDLDRWLFRVASRLAIDELRRHRTWRESVMIDGRHEAEADQDFLAFAASKRGTPEMAAIAKEHLAVCFTCVLRTFSPETAAALLLKEVYLFSVDEIAGILDSSFGQVKAWIQGGRASLRARYDQTCKLVSKDGVCYQCVELDGFFNGAWRDPLENSARSIEDRLAVLRDLKDRVPNAWHERLFEIFTRLD